MMRRVLFFLASFTLAAGTAYAANPTSQNFELDGVFFASNVVLDSSAGVPPSISNQGPTVIDLEPTRVTIAWKTDQDSSSTVDYGPTSSYGQSTGSAELTQDHSITVFGLTPETTYHYRVASASRSGQTATSSDGTFTTPAEIGINTIKISDVSYDSALVFWKTGDLTSSSLEYGTTLSYGQTTSSGSSSNFTSEHTVQLTGLTPGTDYHVRIVATNQRGDTVRSADFIFTTLPNPAFTKLEVQVESSSVASVVWNTNTATTGVLDITRTDAAGDPQSVGVSVASVQHVSRLSGLIGKASYKVVVTATDEQGKRVVSNPQTFTMPQYTVPPVISDLKVNVNRSGNDLVLTATWTTDAVSTSEGTLTKKGSSDAPVKLTPQTSFNQGHTLAKAGLAPATAYNLTVASVDPAGNRSEQSISFVTPNVHKSIFDLLLDSILKSFGWVNHLFG